MTDLDTRILQNASGGPKFKPDEQKKFLGTFEERVIVDCSLEDAENDLLSDHFQQILAKICSDFQPVFVKISPELSSSKQIFYLKTAQEEGCEATIVAECSSPFGLVIHSDQPVEVDEQDMLQHFSDLLTDPQPEKQKKKLYFWKKLFR